MYLLIFYKGLSNAKENFQKDNANAKKLAIGMFILYIQYIVGKNCLLINFLHILKESLPYLTMCFG